MELEPAQIELTRFERDATPEDAVSDLAEVADRMHALLIDHMPPAWPAWACATFANPLSYDQARGRWADGLKSSLGRSASVLE